MKQVTITSKGFKGFVTATFGEMGVGADFYPPLLKVDYSDAEISDEAKAWIGRNLPVRLASGFETGWGQGKLDVVINERLMDFESDFWVPFDYKVHKEVCLKAWDRMPEGTRVELVQGTIKYLRHLVRLSWKNKMLPKTFINQKHYKTNWDYINN